MNDEKKNEIAEITSQTIACALGLTGIPGMFIGVAIAPTLSKIVRFVIDSIELKFLSRKNRENIAHVLENVQQGNIKVVYDIDDDWLFEYFEYVKCVSNQTLQLMWARVLENKIKGIEISKSSLSKFRQFSEEDFILFSKVVPFVVKDSKEHFVPRIDYIDSQLTYSDMLDLSELGFLNPNFQLKITKNAEITDYVYFTNDKYAICAKTKSSSQEFSCPAYRLTKCAKELLSIYTIDYKIEFIKEFRNYLSKNYPNIIFSAFGINKNIGDGYELSDEIL